jgi:hypothetical protein
MSVRRPAPGKPLVTWIAYRIGGAKAVQLGHVEAPDRDAAIAAAAAEYGEPPTRIIVQAISRH